MIIIVFNIPYTNVSMCALGLCARRDQPEYDSISAVCRSKDSAYHYRHGVRSRAICVFMDFVLLKSAVALKIEIKTVCGTIRSIYMPEVCVSFYMYSKF